VTQSVSADVYLAALQPDNDLYPAKKATMSVLFVVFFFDWFLRITQEACQIRTASEWRLALRVQLIRC
jgi:hypothetical protein